MPELTRTSGNMFVQKGPVLDSTNSFKANALVTMTAGVLVLVATAGVLVYGQTPDVQHTAAEALTPPAALFGENHYVFDLSGGVVTINVGALSSGALVTGADLPGLTPKTIANVTLGSSYGIATATSGAYTGFQVLDPTNTANLLFTVVGFRDDVLTTDYNGRVLVKIVPATIQP